MNSPVSLSADRACARSTGWTKPAAGAEIQCILYAKCFNRQKSQPIVLSTNTGSKNAKQWAERTKQIHDQNCLWETSEGPLGPGWGQRAFRFISHFKLFLFYQRVWIKWTNVNIHEFREVGRQESLSSLPPLLIINQWCCLSCLEVGEENEKLKLIYLFWSPSLIYLGIRMLRRQAAFTEEVTLYWSSDGWIGVLLRGPGRKVEADVQARRRACAKAQNPKTACLSGNDRQNGQGSEGAASRRNLQGRIMAGLGSQAKGLRPDLWAPGTQSVLWDSAPWPLPAVHQGLEQIPYHSEWVKVGMSLPLVTVPS